VALRSIRPNKGTFMKSLFLATALLMSPLAVSSAFAQGMPQTLTRLDVSTVASGYRASKIIGASIVNEANDKIGEIDDLIVTRTDRVPYAIVSVGGFLGMGERFVAVPMGDLTFSNDKTLLPGATKTMLEAMPAFAYSK